MIANTKIKSFQLDKPSDFKVFWIGQTISSFGSSITRFILPLMVFHLTGSALDLALSTALTLLPYVFFGLIIGTWVDRVDRRRLMIAADVGRALMLVLLPFLYTQGSLTISWIYIVIFINATLGIIFDSASFAVLPNLVSKEDLVAANGRLSASYSVAEIAGPLLAGVLIATVPLPILLSVDSLSFVLSFVSLVLIHKKFICIGEKAPVTNVTQAIKEGFHFLVMHPIIRWSTLLALFLSLITTTIFAQFVLFAKDILALTDSHLGIAYAAAAGGVVVASLTAGPLNKRVPFKILGFTILIIESLSIIFLANSRQYVLGIVFWAVFSGINMFWNITARSLVQSMVPDKLLGRVISTSRVLTWSLVPLSTMLGGASIEWSQDPALVYGVLGVLMMLIALGFVITPLGGIDNYRTWHPSDEPAMRRSNIALILLGRIRDYRIWIQNAWVARLRGIRQVQPEEQLLGEVVAQDANLHRESDELWPEEQTRGDVPTPATPASHRPLAIALLAIALLAVALVTFLTGIRRYKWLRIPATIRAASRTRSPSARAAAWSETRSRPRSPARPLPARHSQPR